MKRLLNSSLFDEEKIVKLQKAVTLCEQQLNVTVTRVTQELLDARVRMATIGSSYKLYPEKRNDSKPSLLPSASIGNNEFNEDEESPLRDVVVIIDETGCIPAYELLGLYSLSRTIKCIVCVGDKHQLPPYAPNSRQYVKDKRNSRDKGDTEENAVSILDVSALEKTSGKVLLKTQYRVPADIAAILNGHIYGGNYNTAKTANVPLEGFQFVDVPITSTRYDKKYVNKDEIDQCITLLRKLQRDSVTKSIMILTPVSNMVVMQSS